jgi:hypothetical protein
MSSVWDRLDAPRRALLDAYGGEGVVVVRPSLVRALRGHGNAAILVSQLLYWSRRLGDDEGWFYQAQRRLVAQTGLGPDAQRKAVQLLVRLGVLETDRRGVPAKLYYRVNLRQLVALLLRHGQAVSVVDHGPQLEAGHDLELEPEHGPQPDAGDGRRQAAGDGPHHKKINTNIKEETKGDTPPFPPTGPDNPRQRRGRQATPKHALPEDFTVTPAMRAWAAEHTPHVDLDFETEKLVMWAQAKGVWRSDWAATWRSWMLNAVQHGPWGQRRRPSPPERHAGILTWLDQKRKNL